MKQKKYGHLTQFERDRIEALINSGHKQKEIAKILNRDKGTVSREIKRNRRRIRKKGGTVNGKYEASVASHKAYLKRKYSKYQGKKINENNELREYIINGLKKHWNPDEISGRMKKEKKPFYVSKTTIYEWLYSVWGQHYCKYLCCKRYKPRKRRCKKAKRSLIPNRIGIEKRSNKANERKEYGHYEGDCIVSGKKTASKKSLAVIYERKSRYVGIKKIGSLKPKLFNKAIFEMTDELTSIKSLTLDNGIENRHWEEFGINTYFCEPYSSWQKGGIENINGMIRRFVPKGVDISKCSNKYVKMVAEILNSKPRKILGYKTPREVMIENNLLF